VSGTLESRTLPPHTGTFDGPAPLAPLAFAHKSQPWLSLLFAQPGSVGSGIPSHAMLQSPPADHPPNAMQQPGAGSAGQQRPLAPPPSAPVPAASSLAHEKAVSASEATSTATKKRMARKHSLPLGTRASAATHI
jgi:hypothetical protein